MNANRARKMGDRTGLPGFVDRLRYHEASRQGIGLLLLLVCAWMATPGTQKAVWGFVIAALGEAFRVYAAGSIFKNKQLASTGAYSLVRHPLYVGNILILGGFTLAAGNPWTALIVVAFFVFYYPAAIRYEDAKLHRLFGDDWLAWRQRTWALWPRSVRISAIRAGEWDARQSLIRNGELWITIYLVACGAWLWVRAGG